LVIEKALARLGCALVEIGDGWKGITDGSEGKLSLSWPSLSPSLDAQAQYCNGRKEDRELCQIYGRDQYKSEFGPWSVSEFYISRKRLPARITFPNTIRELRRISLN
jgi:hypothetical protein